MGLKLDLTVDKLPRQNPGYVYSEVNLEGQR